MDKAQITKEVRKRIASGAVKSFLINKAQITKEVRKRIASGAVKSSSLINKAQITKEVRKRIIYKAQITKEVRKRIASGAVKSSSLTNKAQITKEVPESQLKGNLLDIPSITKSIQVQTTSIVAMDQRYPSYYPETMAYTTRNPDTQHLTPPNQVEVEQVGRKNARWNDFEHKTFVSAVELVAAEGERSGKCFTRKGWERIKFLFNSQTGHKWSVNQLKNHWGVMRTDHRMFKELVDCTGVEYDCNHSNKIQASSTWWNNKIKENPKYSKFKDQDCSEYYTTYSHLLGDRCDSTRYAMTPTKLCQRGFDLGHDSNSESPNDAVNEHEEGTDSSNGPTMEKVHSSMYVSGVRSGEKRKGRQSKEKKKGREKKKKYGVRELSETVETLASMGNNLNAISLSRKASNNISVDECIEELMSTGLIEDGGDVHMFALSFLTKIDNRKGFQAAKTLENKVKWINWSFNRDLKRFSSRK